MSTARIVVAGAVALLLFGCNRAFEAHEIGGVSEKFCMPKSYAVGRVPWIPADTPKGNGFAFSGCWRGDLQEIDDCALPKTVIGGVVDSSSGFRREQWRDLDEESLIKRTMQDEGASFQVVDEGRAVVASNKRMYWGWFVWRKAQPLAIDGARAQMDAEDELIATCQKKDVALPGTPKTRPAILCQRQVQGKDYALNYSFESKERAPLNVEGLDAQLFAQIDRWRCQQ